MYSSATSLISRPRCRAVVVRCCNNQQQQQAKFTPATIHFETQPALYRSAAQIKPQRHNCTLCSQLSLDRWPRWAQQAESWGGPASVAVYIPAPAGSAAAGAGIQLACQLADQYVHSHPQQPLLVSALFAQHYAREGAAALQDAGINADQHPLLDPGVIYQPSYDQLYPINALRNLALSQAATPLVLCADGDFIFSESLQETLLQPWAAQLLRLQTSSQQQQLLQVNQAALMQEEAAASRTLQQQQQPVMMVLPVFQLVLPQELPDSQRAAVPRNKQQLAQALSAGQVEPFHCGAFPPQRQPVDVDTWLAAGNQPSTSAAVDALNTSAADAAAAAAAFSAARETAAAACAHAYEVQYCEYFEPQGVAVKEQLPLYDECFRGYGLNKVQHAWHCNQLGYSFQVLTDAFMVTAPHKRSSSWRPVLGTATDEAHLARISALYEEYKARLAAQLLGAAGS